MAYTSQNQFPSQAMFTGRSEARMSNRARRLQEAQTARIANPTQPLPTLEELRHRLEGLRQRNPHLAHSTPIQNPPEYTM